MSAGDVFRDPEVARVYAYRASYPDAVFDIVGRLLVEPRTVLDAGAGTGALARRMTSFAERVDALDPSVAMVEAGRALPGGDDPRVRWIVGHAEDAPLDAAYGLIVCGSSLHWMDPDVVLPRFRGALAPGAFVALVETRTAHGAYRDATRAVIDRYEVPHADTPQVLERLVASGRFAVAGEERTEPVPAEQSVDEYIELLHSTSGLARVRLGGRSAAFDAELRAAFERLGVERLRFTVAGVVVWGRPA